MESIYGSVVSLTMFILKLMQTLFVSVCFFPSLSSCCFLERVVLKFWMERKPHSRQSWAVPEIFKQFVWIWPNFLFSLCSAVAAARSASISEKIWREKAGGKKAGEKNLEKKAGEKKFGEEKSVEKKAAEENPSAVCFYAHKQHQVGQFIWLLVTGDPSPNQIPSRIISNFIWNCKRAAAMDL